MREKTFRAKTQSRKGLLVVRLMAWILAFAGMTRMVWGQQYNSAGPYNQGPYAPAGTNEIWVDPFWGMMLNQAAGIVQKDGTVRMKPGIYQIDKLDLDIQSRYTGDVADARAVMWTGADTLWSANSLPNGDTLTFEYIHFKTTGAGDWARLGTGKYLIFRHCIIECSLATILANGDTIIWEDVQVYPLAWTATARIMTTGVAGGGGLLKGSNVRVNDHWWNRTGQKMYGLYINGGNTEFDNFWCFVRDCVAVKIQSGSLGIIGDETWIYGGTGSSETNEAAVELTGALDSCSFSMEGGTLVNFNQTAAAGTIMLSGGSSAVLHGVTIKNKSGEAEANAYYSVSTGASRIIDCVLQGGNGTQNNYTLGANDEMPRWNLAYNKTEGKYLEFFQGDSLRIGASGTAFKQIIMGEATIDAGLAYEVVSVPGMTPTDIVMAIGFAEGAAIGNTDHIVSIDPDVNEFTAWKGDATDAIVFRWIAILK